VPPDASVVSGMIANANLELPSTLDMNGNELILDADGDTSIQAGSDDVISIKTAGGERLTIQADGDTQIIGTTANAISGGDGQLRIRLAATRASGEGPFIGFDVPRYTGDANTEDMGAIGFVASDGTNNSRKADFVLHTRDTSRAERMRVTSSGFVGINTTSPVNQLHVNNSGNEVFCLERSGKSSGSGFAGFNIEGNSQLTISYDDGAPLVIGTASNPSTQAGFTEHFRIANDGTLTATDTSIGSNSDERLKKNIADYTYDLEKFKQYKPKTFDWKNPSTHNGKTGNRGFLAQDVKSIDDKWVGELEITEKNPDYGIISDNVSLTSKLGDKDTMYISVIQQLIAKVETLEAEVAKLKG
jgi:hypothetical protein